MATKLRSNAKMEPRNTAIRELKAALKIALQEYALVTMITESLLFITTLVKSYFLMDTIETTSDHEIL